MLITRDYGTGPAAFADLVFPNQLVWTTRPGRLRDAMLESLCTGGFDADCIRRRVGNWEGQVSAIRAGWVDGLAYPSRDPGEPWIDVWRINAAGYAALRGAGKPVPVMLPARDDWHSRTGGERAFEYCVYELERGGRPVLRLADNLIPCGANWGMDPLLRFADVVVLRDYLSGWIERCEGR